VQTRELSGAVILVVGAGEPIGRASAIAVGSRGANVALADSEPSNLEDTRMAVEAVGGTARVLEDASPEGALAPIQGASDVFGGLDHAILSLELEVSDTRLAVRDPPAFRRFADRRLLALAATMHRTIPPILDGGGGTVVNVASLPEQIEDPQATLAVKLGVMGLTKATAITHAEEPVRISALCPGFPETPVLEAPSLAAPTARARVEALRPVDRFDDPAAVGAGIAALCAPGPQIGAPPTAVSGS
jgi:NAD(P)-dependent dehydrogenase (short-subunit alcohol dehydrogenase family)